LRREHELSLSPSPLGLDRPVFSSECRLCGAVLRVYCGLSGDKRVDSGNSWPAVAESLLFHGDVPPGETFP